jgi:hypothetical protein
MKDRTSGRSFNRGLLILLSSAAFLSFGLRPAPHGGFSAAARGQEEAAEEQKQASSKKDPDFEETLWDKMCSENSGFQGQIIARVTGKGTSFTYHYYFNNIYTLSSTGGRSLLQSNCGRVTVSGNSACRVSEDWNYQSQYDSQAYFDYNTQLPALFMEMEEDEASRRLFYHFWTGYVKEHYGVNYKSWGANHPLKEHVARAEWPRISIGSGYREEIHWPIVRADVQRNYQYLEEITDQQEYTVSLGDKCIQGHQVYRSTINRECPVHVDLVWFFYLGEEEIDVEVDPCPPDWRPEKGRNLAAIMARINKPQGAKGIFRFTLYDVSFEPGYCLNAGDEEGEDLKFLYDEDIFNAPYLDVGEDGQDVLVIESLSAMEYCGIQIIPLDYGAYGKLKVEVNFCGIWLPAHVTGGKKEYVDIPRDDNGNHIADGTFWDRDGAPAESDEDNVPLGNLDVGDGLSQYEEYRGFMMKGEWKATDPGTKDFFVCFDSDLLSWENFDQVSGLSLHEIDESEFSGRSKRVVNFKFKTAHLVDQHGVFVEYGDTKHKIPAENGKYVEIDAEGLTYPVRSPMRSPGDVLKVIINPKAYYGTVAHELGHCVGIDHHGDGNRFITKQELKNGLNPEILPIYLPVIDNLSSKDHYYLAVWQGENSGDMGCFMRYYSAHFYQWRDGQMYPYPTGQARTSLCESAEGTGYNDKRLSEKMFNVEINGKTYTLTLALPMCGDAARGYCKYRICVTDKR